MRRFVQIKPENTFTVDEFNKNKIYAYLSGDGSIYKLQKISSVYAFVRLNDSHCWAAGCGTAGKQLVTCNRLAVGGILEFDTLREFISWANEVL